MKKAALWTSACLAMAACDLNEPQGDPHAPINDQPDAAATSGTDAAASDASASSVAVGTASGGEGGSAVVGSGGEGGGVITGSGGDGGAGEGGSGGEGGSLPEGAFRIAAGWVDVGGRVTLRVLEDVDDGGVVEITDSAVLTSLSPDLLEFVDGRAFGKAGGTASVHIVHDGHQADGEIRVRQWTHLEALPEDGTPASRVIGFDGSLLHAARNPDTLELGLWYAAPDDDTWREVGPGTALGAAPLRGGRYLVIAPYDPEPYPTPLVPAILGPDLELTTPDPPLEAFFSPEVAIPYGLGSCAVILHEAGKQIRRWCEGGDTGEVGWPRADLGRAIAFQADDAGRIALIEESTDGIRALRETDAGTWVDLALDTENAAFTSIAIAPNGYGWVAWSPPPYDGIVAARITPSGFEEPDGATSGGARSQLAISPDGSGVLSWEDPSPPEGFPPRVTTLLPDDLLLGHGGVPFGGPGGITQVVESVDEDGDDDFEVWSTDGTTWTATHDLEACDSTADSFGSLPAGGFARAQDCGGWVFDVYR